MSQPPPTEEQLAAAEDDAASAVEELVAAAVAAGLTAAALTALIPDVTGLIERWVRVGWALGQSFAPPSPRPRRRPRARRAGGVRDRAATVRLLRALDVAGAVAGAIGDAASELREGRPAAGVGERLAGRLRRIALTSVSAAISAGVVAAARIGGAAGLVWVTDADPCRVCRALEGRQVAVGERFPQSGEVRWRGYQGRPPRHPNCRCRLRIVWKTTPAPSRENRRRLPAWARRS